MEGWKGGRVGGWKRVEVRIRDLKLRTLSSEHQNPGPQVRPQLQVRNTIESLYVPPSRYPIPATTQLSPLAGL